MNQQQYQPEGYHPLSHAFNHQVNDLPGIPGPFQPRPNDLAYDALQRQEQIRQQLQREYQEIASFQQDSKNQYLEKQLQELQVNY